jgi:hypothetical protein
MDDHEDTTITKLTKTGKRSYSFTMATGFSFGISDTDIVPKEGDTIRLYGKGFGYTVRGVEINGQEVYYRTEHEQELLHKKQVEDSKREQREKFEANKDQYFADIAALPEVFQTRFKKYAKNNPNFDWEFGDYELFTCKQAVVFADALKTVEALDKFYKAPWKKQKKMVPGMDEGHSGNTFGGAVYLAKLFIMDTLLVEQAHGALAPMVGCTEYGCHTDQDFVEGKDQSDGDNGETVHEGTDQGTDQG